MRADHLATINEAPAVGVNNQNLGGFRQTQRFTNNLRGIHQYRRLQSGGRISGENIVTAIQQIRIDHHHVQVVIRQPCLQCLQELGIASHLLTTARMRHNGHGLNIRIIVQLAGATDVIHQAKIIDAIT